MFVAISVFTFYSVRVAPLFYFATRILSFCELLSFVLRVAFFRSANCFLSFCKLLSFVLQIACLGLYSSWLWQVRHFAMKLYVSDTCSAE